MMKSVAIGLFGALAMVACAQTDQVSIPPDALEAGESFVAIARPSDSSSSLRHAAKLNVLASSGPITNPAQSGSNDFYLAISKKELGQRWFLSGFLKQYYPGAVNQGAVRSMGTRVVSFKVQNGKLFVFDVADNKKTSDLFDPQVLVEAYPIVTDYAAFNGLSNHDNYVLFDPSAGMNKFGVAGDLYDDWYLGTSGATDFQIGVSFMQNFRKISDGVTYEQLFTGQGAYYQGGQQYQVTASGTVGVALRKYSEGAGYTLTPYPQSGSYYFQSDWK